MLLYGDDRDRDEANEVSVIEVMPRDARESTYDEACEREEANEVSGFKLTILLNRIISRHGFTLMPTE